MKEILIISLIGLILIFILSLCKFEKYDNYNPNKPLNFFNKLNYLKDNKKLLKFNQNYDATWMKPQVAYNNDKYHDIDILREYELHKYNNYYTIRNNQLNVIIKKFNKKYTINKYLFNKKISKPLVKDDQIKKDWVIILDIDFNELRHNLQYKPLNDKNLTKIFKYFLINFNKLFISQDEFYINKYKIINKYRSKNIYYYKLLISLFRSLTLYNFFNFNIEVFVVDNTIIMNNIELISNEFSASELISSNYENDYFNITKNSKYDNINYYNSTKLLDKKLQDIDENMQFKNDFRCFNIENNDLFKYYSINECESEKNIFNKYKHIGILDKPCKSDKECKYYKSNQNYLNNRGRCLKNGLCELPVKSQRLGYHFETIKSKQLCYNCETTEWLPNTNIAYCCEKQDKNDKNYNKKYDFLKSPDYYFSNDIEDRLNFDIQNKYEEGKLYYSKKDDDWNLYNS